MELALRVVGLPTATQLLTHEEWVNAGRYSSLFGAPPPANPARNTNPA